MKSSGGVGARLVDAATQEGLDRLLDPGLIAHYGRGFPAHQETVAVVSSVVAPPLVAGGIVFTVSGVSGPTNSST
jgi:hypothetical protein